MGDVVDTTVDPKGGGVLLLSGGPDSASLGGWCLEQQMEDVKALYLKCGHTTDERELQSADVIARDLSLQLEIIDISHLIAGLGGQRLLIHSQASILPFGNLIAMGIAFSFAQRMGASQVLTALHGDDAAESPEYSRAFLDGIEGLASSVGHDIRIVAPFLSVHKFEVLAVGQKNNIDLAQTWSCIRPSQHHCGTCGACRARARAFVEADLVDGTVYEQAPLALESVPAAR